MSGNFGSTAAGGFGSGGVASFLSLRLGSPIAKRRVEVDGAWAVGRSISLTGGSTFDGSPKKKAVAIL